MVRVGNIMGIVNRLSPTFQPVRVLDAIRIRDDRQVIIKMLIPRQREGQNELAVLEHFSSPGLNDLPDNHVVRCLDSFPIPGEESGRFIVMPLLGSYRDPPFINLAELHDFLHQMFKASISAGVQQILYDT
jgi:hypothetical protein